eukprot:scaffold35308_cov32-Tisochrysis_lutea.AAC.2
MGCPVAVGEREAPTVANHIPPAREGRLLDGVERKGREEESGNQESFSPAGLGDIGGSKKLLKRSICGQEARGKSGATAR